MPETVEEIRRDSMRDTVTLEEVQRLKNEGKRIKFICRGEYSAEEGKIQVGWFFGGFNSCWAGLLSSGPYLMGF